MPVHVIMCALVDRRVLEEPSASIFRTEVTVGSSESLVPIYQTTQHHLPKDHNLYVRLKMSCVMSELVSCIFKPKTPVTYC
jgi:hypothetical protein